MKSATKVPAILKRLFSSGTRVKILELLLLNPKERFYQRQLAERLGLPILAVQREIRNLESIRLIDVNKDGNRVYCSINPKFPILPELATMFLKTAAVGTILGKELARRRAEVDAAFIYGSYAKGDPQTWSDIDVMVIGKVSDLALSEILDKVEKRISREVNHMRYTPEEFRKRVRQKDNFVLNVLDEPKVFIIGDQDGLERAARQ